MHIRTGEDKVLDVEFAQCAKPLVRRCDALVVETTFHTPYNFRKAGVVKGPYEEESQYAEVHALDFCGGRSVGR